MARGPIESVAECFEDVEDPRVEGRCAHRLTAIMGVALCAIISGADNWVEVEQYGQAEAEHVTQGGRLGALVTIRI